jgi:hypothetical protein
VTDCDVLAVFSEVQKYLSEVQARAEQAESQVNQCLNNVRRLHCTITGAIDNARLIPFSPGDINGFPSGPSPMASAGRAEPIGDHCAACAEALAGVPQRLDALESEVGSCSAQFDALSDALGEINAAIESDGGLSATQKRRNQQTADQHLARAEEASARASDADAALADVGGACSLTNVTTSCETCSPESELRHRSRAVLVEWNGQPIGRLVGEFHAAARTGPVELAERLRDLAFRLIRLQDDRVLHVTFRTTSPISQDFVALAPRPAGVVDNGRAPLAIVLTGLSRDAPLPAMTAHDQRLVFNAMRAFYDLVVLQHK